jgi:anti-sigma factor RsiW
LSCELAQTIVHGYFDGELDAVRAAEFEQHLKSCAECQGSLANMKALRMSLRGSELDERASAGLQERLYRELDLGRSSESQKSGLALRRYWLPAFAALVVVVAFLFILGSRRSESLHLSAELIDAHVRSLQPGHLMDVQSTDQHTVKPWFDGKLDFIPPVGDYSAQGFPLLGGRLDVIDGRNVAALVYGRRKHFINLFVWPASNVEKVTDSSGSRQGYNWALWQSGDMDYSLVSDASPADVRELRELIHH